MGFTEMRFDPADGLRNESFDTTPVSEDAAREQIQGRLDEIKDYINNYLSSELESIVPDQSGAERVGSAAIDGITYIDNDLVEHSAVTVHMQIKRLKEQLTQAVTEGFGEGDITTNMIADGAIDNTKLAQNAVETSSIKNAQISNDKLAENSVSYDKIQADAVRGGHIQDNSITDSKIKDGAVTAGKIGANAVATAQIAEEAVTQTKLGIIQSITLASGDTISYDETNNTLKLNVNGCTSVQLAPIIFGTSAAAPSGTFPKGTLYMTHEV